MNKARLITVVGIGGLTSGSDIARMSLALAYIENVVEVTFGAVRCE